MHYSTNLMTPAVVQTSDLTCLKWTVNKGIVKYAFVYLFCPF